MGTITSFLSSSPIVVYLLIPTIIILVVLLVIINKGHKVEVVAQVAVPPVTTIPAQPLPSEVVAQAITAPVVGAVAAIAAETLVVEPVITVPVVEKVVPETASIPMPETPAVTPTWRPAEPAPVAEQTIEEITPIEPITPLEAQALSSIVEPMPVVADVVSSQAIVPEPIAMTPVVEEVSSALVEEVQQPPLIQPVV